MKTLAILAAIFIRGIAEADSMVTLHCEGTYTINPEMVRLNALTNGNLTEKSPEDGSWDLEINLDKKELSQGIHSEIPFVSTGNTLSWELLHVKDTVFWQYFLNSISAELIEETWGHYPNPDVERHPWVRPIERWGEVYKQEFQSHFSCKKVDKLF